MDATGLRLAMRLPAMTLYRQEELHEPLIRAFAAHAPFTSTFASATQLRLPLITNTYKQATQNPWSKGTDTTEWSVNGQALCPGPDATKFTAYNRIAARYGRQPIFPRICPRA